MVEGGVCWRPGPSLRAIDEFEGIGRISGEMISPGSTSICVAIGQIVLFLKREASCLDIYSRQFESQCF